MPSKVSNMVTLAILASLIFSKTFVQASERSTDHVTAASAASPSTSTGSVTHTIQVGSKSSPHAYVPHSLSANPGDIVVFEFYPTNHSVVKADFGAPCVPASDGVFFSGMFDSFNLKDGQLAGPVRIRQFLHWERNKREKRPVCSQLGIYSHSRLLGL